MAKIHLLDDALITKIAAGEIIERPASIVKELIENAIDAKADEMKLVIEQAGKRKIRIIDNGEGMDEQDLSMCCKRHATSKIKDENDLFEVRSLGFRGEALASIAQVSSTRIVSKTLHQDTAMMIEIEGGKQLKKEHVGAPKGTSIEITDLFFNVPARKKFLKSDEVELNHITTIVTKYALLHKHIAFSLSHNGKEILNTPKTLSQQSNIAFIYGAETAKNLLEIDYQSDTLSLSGFISKPMLTRSDKSDQSLYVNNRYVKSNTIADAIYEAYHTLLFINRHPLFILNLTIDPAKIDVNVHPAKTTIKLKDEEAVKKEIITAIKQALFSANLVAQESLDSEGSASAVSQYAFSKEKQETLQVKEEAPKKYEEKETEDKIPEEIPKIPKIGPFNILGQINKTYIIAENPQGLAIIDQHAAEERVNYEKFMSQLQDNAIKKQDLVNAQFIDLTPNQYQSAKENEKHLQKLGFSFEDFGNNTVKLTAIPQIFDRIKSNTFVDIINELLASKSTSMDEEIESRIVRFSCRASIKAGEELTRPQMQKLLQQLEEVKNPYSCPHGRPTLINLSIADFEKKFKRTGW